MCRPLLGASLMRSKTKTVRDSEKAASAIQIPVTQVASIASHWLPYASLTKIHILRRAKLVS